MSRSKEYILGSVNDFENLFEFVVGHTVWHLAYIDDRLFEKCAFRCIVVVSGHRHIVNGHNLVKLSPEV